MNMRIVLDKKTQKFIVGKVSAGEIKSPSDVVRKGVALLRVSQAPKGPARQANMTWRVKPSGSADKDYFRILKHSTKLHGKDAVKGYALLLDKALRRLEAIHLPANRWRTIACMERSLCICGR